MSLLSAAEGREGIFVANDDWCILSPFTTSTTSTAASTEVATVATVATSTITAAIAASAVASLAVATESTFTITTITKVTTSTATTVASVTAVTTIATTTSSSAAITSTCRGFLVAEVKIDFLFGVPRSVAVTSGFVLCSLEIGLVFVGFSQLFGAAPLLVLLGALVCLSRFKDTKGRQLFRSLLGNIIGI